LDDLLSELAKAAGEMMLREFSPTTVQRIVGRGAAWPDQQREDFLNAINLDIVAASSGRPNKAVDVQVAQQLVPLMAQAGANPWALIKYLANVMDANLDPMDFAPQNPPMPQGQPGQQPQGQSPAKKPEQHPQHPGVVGQQQGGQQPVAVQQGGAH
jgi:hypothetical protein